MKALIRILFILAGLAPVALISLLVPREWRPASLAIVGGLSGAAWSGVQYLDQTRAGPPAKRGFVTLFFALYAFGCLAAAEVVETLQAAD